MQEKVTNILEDKIPKLQHDVKALKKATDENKEEIERLENDNALLKTENESSKEKIEDLLLKVEHQSKTIRNQNTRLSEIENTLDGISDNIKDAKHSNIHEGKETYSKVTSLKVTQPPIRFKAAPAH